MSVFAQRGLSVEVVTTEQAELDIALFKIAEGDVTAIGRNLREVAISPRDREVEGAPVREVAGYDVVFLLTADTRGFTVTISNVRPPDPVDPLEVQLGRLDILATLRGALGW